LSTKNSLPTDSSKTLLREKKIRLVWLGVADRRSLLEALNGFFAPTSGGHERLAIRVFWIIKQKNK
jgi:hypothetical protein